MRISDWSSDVCSSDLPAFRTSTSSWKASNHNMDERPARRSEWEGNMSKNAGIGAAVSRLSLCLALATGAAGAAGAQDAAPAADRSGSTIDEITIGRAACRERICKYV